MQAKISNFLGCVVAKLGVKLDTVYLTLYLVSNLILDNIYRKRQLLSTRSIHLISSILLLF